MSVKKFVAAATSALVLFSGLAAVSPAVAAPTVAWDVSTLDWQLIDNPETIATDVYSRPKATITYQWSSTGDAGTDCVAWHVDSSATSSFQTTLSNAVETKTNWNLDLLTGTYTTEIVYDWSEIVDKLSLDHTATHQVEVQVHNVDCATADIDGETVTSSATLNIASAPTATPQGWDWSASLGLSENSGNTIDQPDLGGAANADDWIYQGEDATFTHEWISGSGTTWDGPISYNGGQIDSMNVCVIDVVNQDDVHVDPETANVSRGYDYMNIGWAASSVSHEVGDGELSYNDPQAQTSTTTYAWNTLIASGFNSGAYSFDPTQVNSITRYIFQGGCYETFNYGTSSGSAANTTTPVNGSLNYASEQRYLSTDSPAAPTVNWREWDYYWHPRAAADIRADIWAARNTAIDVETVYLGPADTSITVDNESVGRGESVTLSRDWFDGNGQCIAWFVDGVYGGSEAVSVDGAGSDDPDFTFEDLIDIFGLDNTVAHTIEWRIFGQSCAAIDESTATPAGTATVALEPDESSIAADNESVAPGEDITIDRTWFDGNAQCMAIIVDGVRVDSDAVDVDGAGSDTWVFTWAELIDDYSLDPAVEHTIEYKIYNGACADLNLDTATPMESVSFDVEPILPSVGFSVPEVGPGDSVTLDVSWADLNQCIAVFIDDEFFYWGEIAPPASDEFGTYSSDSLWLELMYVLEDEVYLEDGRAWDWSISHSLSYRIYDDSSVDPAGCLDGAEPTLDVPTLDTADLTLLPLAPVLEPSDDEVDPTEEATLDVDRETYADLVAAHYVDGVFMGCVIVSDIPETVSWDSLDDSYSRDTEHDVTYDIFPIFVDDIDIETCSEELFADVEPLTSATVVLVPASLAETGLNIGWLGWIAAAALVAGARLIARRRVTAN